MEIFSILASFLVHLIFGNSHINSAMPNIYAMQPEFLGFWYTGSCRIWSISSMR